MILKFRKIRWSKSIMFWDSLLILIKDVGIIDMELNRISDWVVSYRVVVLKVIGVMLLNIFFLNLSLDLLSEGHFLDSLNSLVVVSLLISSFFVLSYPLVLLLTDGWFYILFVFDVFQLFDQSSFGNRCLLGFFLLILVVWLEE